MGYRPPTNPARPGPRRRQSGGPFRSVPHGAPVGDPIRRV